MLVLIFVYLVRALRETMLRLCGYNMQTRSAAGNKVGLELADFLQVRGLVGCQTKMILGRTCHDTNPVTDEDLKLAVNALDEHFLFVGVMERWQETIEVFHQYFGGNVLPIELKVNRQQKKVRPRDAGCCVARACLMHSFTFCCYALVKAKHNFGEFRDPIDEALYAAILVKFEDQIRRAAQCDL